MQDVIENLGLLDRYKIESIKLRIGKEVAGLDNHEAIVAIGLFLHQHVAGDAISPLHDSFKEMQAEWKALLKEGHEDEGEVLKDSCLRISEAKRNMVGKFSTLATSKSMENAIQLGAWCAVQELRDGAA